MNQFLQRNEYIASSAQKRIWFLNTFDPNSSTYNVVFFWKIESNISLFLLQKSINYLIKRHCSLRTYFASISGELRQILSENLEIEIQEFNADKLDQNMLRFAKKTFDLKHLPLFAVALFKNDKEESIIGFNFHHIICDGWSLEIFFKELSNTYDAFSKKTFPELQEIPNTYLEYSRIESKILDSIEEEALEYWKKYLHHLPLLSFPTDYPRPAVQHFEGQREIIYLDPSTSRLLKEKSKQSNSSLYILLLSAFFLVLRQYSDQKDLVIGSPVANRGELDFINTLGLFVNSIVIRCNFNQLKIETFDQLMDAVQEDFLNSLEFQSYPFEKVVENIQPDRALSHNPLFQVMFILQDNSTRNSLTLNQSKAESIDLNLSQTRFDLECTIWETETGIKIRLNYNTCLYHKTTIEGLLKLYEKILKELSLTPFEDIKIDSKHLYELPQPYMSISLGNILKLPQKTPVDLIFEKSLKYPEQISLIYTSKKINYKDLEEKSAKIATYLFQQTHNTHSPEQKKIVLIMRPSIEMALIIIAILRTNIILVPINPDDPLKRKQSILEAINPDLVLSSEEEISFQGILINPQTLIEDALSLKVTPFHFEKNTLEGTAYIIHTSGTTGAPKGVEIKHKHLLNTLMGSAQNIRLNHEDIFASWSSFSFDIFYLELLLPLLCGACVRIVTREELFNPHKVNKILSTVSCIHAVPGLMNQLIDITSTMTSSLPNLRYALTGGDLVPDLLLEKMQKLFPQAKKLVLYGPTEATIICMTYLHSTHGEGRHIIGKPLANVEIRICDSDCILLPRGVIGEILIGGAGVSKGYIKELHQDKFVTLNGQKFYRTGDKGKLAFDNNFEFHGRDDNQIKLRGFRINLNEISSAISNYPAVDNAVTILYKQNAQLEYIVSYVVINWQNLKLTPDEFIDNWKHLFDNTHKENKEEETSDFNGWQSAINGQPLPHSTMESWLESTIKSILDEVDTEILKQKKLRVLEIGCGTGLILFKLIDYCQAYLGTDFSSEILLNLQSKIPAQHADKISLVNCSADKIQEISQEKFDIVILNSVCQYFPNSDYLEKVLREAKTFLSERGILFLGDIRAKHISKYLYKEISNHELKAGIIQPEEQDAYISTKEFFDSELLISPSAFDQISKDLSLACFITPRLDTCDSELASYRYNIVFKNIDQKKSSSLIHWQPWQDLESFIENLSLNQSFPIGFEKIPNSRVNDSSAEKKVSLLTLLEIIKSKNLEAKVSWHNRWKEGEYDLIIFDQKSINKDIHYFLPIRTEKGEKNFTEPHKKKYLRTLEKEIIIYLSDVLPSYMIPKQIEFLDSIPLGMNAKVNKKALPVPRLLKIESCYVAPENYLQKDICHTWSTILGINQIGINDNFFKLGGTSLLAIQAAIQLRKKGINLRPQVLFKYQTVKEIANFISKEQKGNLITASTISSVRMNGFHKTAHVTTPGILNLAKVLFLGATGFLGIYLLKTLLQEEECQKIYCVIRAKTQEEAFERLYSLFKWYFPSEDSTLLKKVIPLAGDISSPNMGLAEDVWQEIQQQATSIFNAAAIVSHVGTEKSFDKTNVQGIHNLIKIAKQFSLKKLIHVSTIGVKGLSGTHSHDFTEMDLDIGQSMTEYYSESKLKAELYLNEYIKEGGDVLIFRVGMIAPSFKEGIFQKNIQSHFFSRYIKSILNLGIAPMWKDRYLSLTPVDNIALFILEISKLKNKISTFHINNIHKVSYFEISIWLQEMGYEIKILAQDLFTQYIDKIAADKNLSSLLDGLVQLIDTSNLIHNKLSCDLTNAVLSENHLQYPKVEYEWFKKFMIYGRNLNYFPYQVLNNLKF